MPPGVTLEFKFGGAQVSQILVKVKGVPEDFYSARIGMFPESSVNQRVIILDAGVDA
jgi:hypothetical protein